jgi:hypothetical protein
MERRDTLTRNQVLQLAFLLRFHRRWGNFAAGEVAKHLGDLKRVQRIISGAMAEAAEWQTWVPDATMELDAIALQDPHYARRIKRNGQWETK